VSVVWLEAIAREIWVRQALLGKLAEVEEWSADTMSWGRRAAFAFGLAVEGGSAAHARQRVVWYFRVASGGLVWWSRSAFFDMGRGRISPEQGAQEFLSSGLTVEERRVLEAVLRRFRAKRVVFDFNAHPEGPTFQP
jgi:hypothetical protein